MALDRRQVEEKVKHRRVQCTSSILWGNDARTLWNTPSRISTLDFLERFFAYLHFSNRDVHKICNTENHLMHYFIQELLCSVFQGHVTRFVFFFPSLPASQTATSTCLKGFQGVWKCLESHVWVRIGEFQSYNHQFFCPSKHQILAICANRSLQKS